MWRAIGAGFIKTGSDLSKEDLELAKWPLARALYLLETSLPGVFAVGDVRGGNVKRVASAVGEGSICCLFRASSARRIIETSREARRRSRLPPAQFDLVRPCDVVSNVFKIGCECHLWSLKFAQREFAGCLRDVSGVSIRFEN